jgi:hypothetical protein
MKNPALDDDACDRWPISTTGDSDIGVLSFQL